MSTFMSSLMEIVLKKKQNSSLNVPYIATLFFFHLFSLLSFLYCLSSVARTAKNILNWHLLNYQKNVSLHCFF